MTIGEMIRQERKKKGITQNELAKRLGITQSAVGQFEKKDSGIRYETVQKIAEALEVPIYTFFLNEGERVKSIRENKGLTQTDLAEKVNLSAQLIDDIEQCKYRPSNSMLMKLANALEIPVSELIPGEISTSDIVDSTINVNTATEGLKAIIRRLYHCDDDHPSNSSACISFTKNNHSYYITDQAFNELLPLVDGLVGAYVEQRKIQFT